VILTVTLNFGLDVTYHVEAIRHGETVRVPEVARRAGGKGVNCARVLNALGRDTVVTGFAGGFNGMAARAELEEARIPDATVPIDAESRLTLMVVDADGAATGFSELGPQVSASHWQAQLGRIRELLSHAEAVVIAGSVPPGVPSDGCGEVVALAAEAAVPALVDVDGEHLLGALGPGPDVVKINRAELFGVVDADDVVSGAAKLCQAGARTVVISEGAEGLVCVHDGTVLRAAPPRALSGNPTGAGDAASAALAIALVDGVGWSDALADATALSASAVVTPLAGSFDERVYRDLRAQIATQRVAASA
jgi:tagatose 6-phosphate kinase